jgi:hypothetical protein
MKECPFCGYDEGWVRETPEGYKVICKVCGGEGPPAKTYDMSRKKWDGILNKIESQDKFEEALKEMEGGVSTPAATLTNVPGVGDAQPAAFAAMTGAQQYDSGAIGSGDKWGGSEPKKKKKKKATTKHKISSYEDFAAKFPLGKPALQK